MYRNILVPLDINDPVNAEAALAHAGFLAREGGVIVHLLHVGLRLPWTYAQMLPAGWEKQNEAETRDWLNSMRERLSLPENQVTMHLSRGSVCAETLRIAGEVNADLIIIGSSMPTTSRRILGSNAAAIVRDAQVSVLVVRQSATPAG